LERRDRAKPDDYNIIHEGQIVGRMYRMNSTGRELWRWTRSGIFQPSHGPNGGVADSRDEAKAAFRAAWQRRLSGTEERRQDMLNLSLSGSHPTSRHPSPGSMLLKKTQNFLLLRLGLS
jgi:hypothetical protein